MKKLLLFTAAATMLAACTMDTTEDVAVNCLPYDVLHVSVGDEDESRIQLDGNSRIVWNEGDRVSVFNKTNGNECWKFNGKTGDKRGTLSKVSGNAGSKTNKVVALYPYDSNCAVSGNMISTPIPATQTYRADSFGEGGNIMVAVSDDDELQFKHIFGWIKLSLTDNLNRIVTSIAFSGNNNENLAGNAIIDASTQKVYINDNIKSLILNLDYGIQLSADTPTYFYIAVLPQKFAKGVSIDVTLTNKSNVSSLKKCYEDSFTVIRNHIQPIQATNFKSVNDKIIYTTSNNSQIGLQATEGFGTKFVSHTYKNGQGIIQFEGDITSIPESAFFDCSSLTSINIPDGVTSIGDKAFYDCSRLTSINIPDSVTSIGQDAFYSCNRLRSVTIPDSVTSIGEYAFFGCSSLTGVYITDIARWCAIEFGSYYSNPLMPANNLYLNGELVTDLVIPDGVTSIGNYAFCGCSTLKSITIPDGVTSIGDSAFYGCSSLTSFTIPDGVTSIGNSAFYYCRSLINVTIGDSVTSIGDKAFYDCESLKFIVIPDGVTSIGSSIFYNCKSLTNIIIPDSVTSIGDSVFYNCKSLTYINIPDSITSIGDSAFSYCSSLKSVTIPDSVTSIGDSVFYNCKSLTNINIPDSITAIGDGEFYYCSSLTSITIPDSVTSIGKLAFYYCSSLKSITIPNSVTSIGSSAFYGCTGECIINCNIPDGLNSDDYAFKNSKFTKITIEDGVTFIGWLAFYECNSLTCVTIGDSVTSIGDWAFLSCSNLTNIYCKANTPPTISNNTFHNVFSCTLYVPTGCKMAYAEANNWSKFTTIIEM